jgi:putative ABC transport system permease protein
MIAAIAVSLAALGTLLGAVAILRREMSRNYLGTRPASATLELDAPVDDALVDAVRSLPDVEEAESRGTILARVKVGDDYRPLLLFVIDDFADLRLNTFRPERGRFPPPDGTFLLERSAVGMVEASVGDRVLVKTPHGRPREIEISGLVHDPGLAPAWQERMGYAYASRATAALLGESSDLHELRVALPGADRAAVERSARGVAAWLEARDLAVHEIRIPPPRTHPHELQMVTVLVMMLVFSALALVLSGIVCATSLAALLARQVREIGVMKTIGARTSQIARMYAVLVLGIGGAAALAAIPPSMLAARAFARQIADMLNFTLASEAIPGWVFAVEVAAALVVPLALAAIPIWRASRATVKAALIRHGAGTIRESVSALPVALRNALRRPARLALTVALLSAGGAMFVTALDVSESWRANIDAFRDVRHYDLEVRFNEAEPLALADRVRRLPGVRTVEAWGYAPASFTSPGELEITRTYPDGRHASFAVLGPPPATSLIALPVQEGRWLREGDVDGVVLNHAALAQRPSTVPGATIDLAIDGTSTRWRVAGVVEEIGSPPAAYVTDAAFARATGTPGSARMLRIATSASSAAERIEILRGVESLFDREGVSIEQALPLAEHETALGDHIAILINALLAMALVLATVGLLGLGSTMATHVIEREREIAVMKAVGATGGRIVRMVLVEALSIAAASALLATLVAVPLTLFVDWLLGNLGFMAALPFVFDAWPPLVWLGAALVGAALASLVPARRAALIGVRAALSRPG